MRVIVAVLLMVGLRGAAGAEDVGAVAAALKGEAVECSYLQKLCERITASTKAMADLKAESPQGPDWSARAAMMMGQSMEAVSDLGTAMEVIEAKRGKKVSCPGNGCLPK